MLNVQRVSTFLLSFELVLSDANFLLMSSHFLYCTIIVQYTRNKLKIGVSCSVSKHCFCSSYNVDIVDVGRRPRPVVSRKGLLSNDVNHVGQLSSQINAHRSVIQINKICYFFGGGTPRRRLCLMP